MRNGAEMIRWAGARSMVAVAIAAGCSDREGACERDRDCGALACVDERCAAALDDPGGPGIPEGGPVRVVALGLHPTLADVESQQTWRAYVRGVFEQDVASRIATDRPTLVVLPENAALMGAFIGSRGAEARTATTAESALASVLFGYVRAFDHYGARAQSSLAPGRLVGLAVTDTVWRALTPFSELAAELGIWIAVTTNVADAERVTEPALIEILVDEAETDRSFAWQASSDDVYNQTIVWNPSGEIVSAWRKEYLVPLEEASEGLSLSFGAPGSLTGIDLPFGRVSSVISKDAWMPDVLDRLALDGTALMLQPEAFSGWGIWHGDELAWAPDVVKESGWAHVLRYPEFRVNVLPCLSQNLFDLVFDCQSTILVDPTLGDATDAWIGQDPDVGFAAIAPWFAQDDRMGTLQERRERLIVQGERLLPGGDAEDEYVAGVVHLDVDLGRGKIQDDGNDAHVAPSDRGEQRRPTAVRAGDRTLVLWEDDRNGQTRIYGALSAGEAFGDARVRIATAGEVRAIRAAAQGERVHVVWQEANATDLDVRYAMSDDGGRSFGEPVTLGEARDAAAYVPDVALDADGTIWIAWVDLRDTAARIVVTHRGPNDAAFAADQQLEAPPEAYRTRENRWAPSIAVTEGRVAVAWTDFRSFRWEIWGTFGGADGFSPPVRLDDADVTHETIHTDPRVAWVDDALVLAWTDLRVRQPDYDVRVRRIQREEPASSPPSILVAQSDAAGRPQWRPALAVDGSIVVVAWQDVRTTFNELRIARSDDAGRTFGPDTALFSDTVPRCAPTLAETNTIVFETLDRGPRRIATLAVP